MSKPMKQSGFTLIELLLYVVLCTVFLAIVSQIFLAALDVQTESEGYVAIELDGRYILTRLTNDIHRATAITEPATATSAALLGVTIDGNEYRYASSGGNLVLTTPNGTYTLNGQDTTLVDFGVTRVGMGSDIPSVKFSVTLTAKTVPVQGAIVRTYETTAGLR